MTDPRKLKWTYTYNGFGDVTSVDSPDAGLTRYAYDSYMRGTIIVVMYIAMCSLVACSEEKLKDVSSDPTYKDIVGAEYEIVGPLLALLSQN